MDTLTTATPPLTTHGHIMVIRDDHDRALFHEQHLTISDDRVTVSLVGAATDETHPPIESTHPAVIAFLREIEALRLATAYQPA